MRASASKKRKPFIYLFLTSTSIALDPRPESGIFYRHF